MSESKLREALSSLLEVQDDECRFDHSGYCQSHYLDHVSDGCRVVIAREALAQIGEHGDPVAFTDGLGQLWLPGECVATKVAIPLYASPTIPEGYALAPIEPTRAMSLAGKHAVQDAHDMRFERDQAIAIWSKMLEAATFKWRAHT